MIHKKVRPGSDRSIVRPSAGYPLLGYWYANDSDPSLPKRIHKHEEWFENIYLFAFDASLQLRLWWALLCFDKLCRIISWDGLHDTLAAAEPCHEVPHTTFITTTSKYSLCKNISLLVKKFSKTTTQRCAVSAQWTCLCAPWSSHSPRCTSPTPTPR